MEKKDILVVGASNIDIMGVPRERLVERDSNPGRVHISHGGVGRNIVENLARLSVSVGFITVLGEDSFGEMIKGRLEKLGVVLHAEKAARTPVYLAIHDAQKDMFLALNDMEALASLTKDSLQKHEKLMKEAAVVVIDTNLAEEAIDYVTKTASKVFVDAVSLARVRRLKPYLGKIHTLKLNRDELSTLAETPTDHDDSLQETLQRSHQAGVYRIAVTMGAEGALLSDAQGVRKLPALQVPVVNTTGAGDAFTAGLAYAEALGQSPLPLGIALASFSLETAESVHPGLTEARLAKRIPSG